MMERLEEIQKNLISFEKQVGWDSLHAENTSKLAQLLIAEAVELLEEINKESSIGLNKYDVSLEVADVFIYLQKICIALDIDMLECVEDKMLINRARFLNKEYYNKAISPKPKAGRYYKINNTYNKIEVKDDAPMTTGKLYGIKNDIGQNQDVYIIDEELSKVEYMKKIVAIVIPRNQTSPIWIAADNELQISQISDKLKLVDYLYDIELV